MCKKIAVMKYKIFEDVTAPPGYHKGFFNGTSSTIALPRLIRSFMDNAYSKLQVAWYTPKFLKDSSVLDFRRKNRYFKYLMDFLPIYILCGVSMIDHVDHQPDNVVDRNSVQSDVFVEQIGS